MASTPQSTAERARAIVRRRAAGLFAAVCGFGCALVAVGALVSEPPVPDFTPKWARYLELRSELDVLFVGSSRTFRHVSPAVFDRTVGLRGLEVRSFNFGLTAMTLAELGEVIARIRRAGPPYPRYFVLEVDGWHGDIAKRNVDTARVVYWHSFEATWYAIRASWVARRAWTDKLENTRRHLKAFALRASNLGRLRYLLGLERRGMSAASSALGRSQDGWVPFEKTARPAPGQRAEMDERRRWAAEVAQRSARSDAYNSACLDDIVAAKLADLARTVGELGAEPIFMVSPTLKPRCPIHVAARNGTIATLIAYDDPRTHPEFFAWRYHHDREHLNRQGAVALTRNLAHRFADHVGAGASHLAAGSDG